MGFNPHGYCPTCGSMKHDQDCVFCGEQRELQIINAPPVPLEQQTIEIWLEDGTRFQSTIGEVCTLATRLAAVERERDALREGLLYLRSDLAHAIETGEYVEQVDTAFNRVRALLGKENTDGNATR